MMENKHIRHIDVKDNIFYFRYVEQIQQQSAFNQKLHTEQQIPKCYEEKDRLLETLIGQGILHQLEKEIEKAKVKEKSKAE